MEEEPQEQILEAQSTVPIHLQSSTWLLVLDAKTKFVNNPWLFMRRIIQKF